MEFEHAPDEPANELAERGQTVLLSARTTAASLMTLHDGGDFEEGTEVQQDLLRATLLLATAGIDSMVKQLVHDALPLVIASKEGARAKLADFVDRRLRREDQSGMKLVAAALASNTPRAAVVDALVSELRSSSLQSVEELSKAVAFFDIPTADVIEDVARLANVFEARNQIAHEMDVDFSQEAGHRIPRERDSVVDYVNEIFGTASAILREVDARLTPSD
jgi:hypothetical protein